MFSYDQKNKILYFVLKKSNYISQKLGFIINLKLQFLFKALNEKHYKAPINKSKEKKNSTKACY